MRQPLPADLKILYRICRAHSPNERKAVQAVLAEFFTNHAAQYNNKRCDRELEKILNYIDRQTAKANAGAELRRSRGAAKPDTSKKVRKKESKINPLSPQIPDWIPAEDWQNYCAMRSKIRKPMTSRAIELAITKLAELKAEGHDPAKILQNSVFNSYQGLFAPNQQKPQHSVKRAQMPTQKPV